jgi:hypothetical protein
MLIGFDANFFAIFISACATGESQSAIQAENKAEELGQIVADEGGLILQEWKDATGSHAREFVEEWINDALLELRIKLFKSSGCSICRADVVRRGMPHKDAKRLSIYKDVGTGVIISNDIDFFEPSEANCSPRRRERLCFERKGSLCRHVEKEYGIAIYTYEAFLIESF